jgi:Kef-type K+ transport system membrane component KefB
MAMRRSVLFYSAMLLVFGAGIYAILGYGSRMEVVAQPAESAVAVQPASPAAGKVEGLLGHLQQPLSLLLLQVIIILAAARGLGALFAKIGQPRVIGEMVAGILLGPSLLGLLFPGTHAFVFPASSLGSLQMLSQIGVILFMFVVGIELDIDHLRHKAHAAVVVSHASIVVPFFLGCALALAVYRNLAPAGARFSAFALFIGVAMSITAFPVLARIIDERRMRRSHLGSTAIACAAVDDVTAWCLLAVVVALANSDGLGGAAWTILLTLVFIAAMLFVVRPRLARMPRLVREQPEGQSSSMGLLAGIFVFLFVSALATEMIGIHALFGAFLAGVCMPPNSALRQFLRERLETFSSVLLLPLFFAFTGLRTEIGLLNDWPSWLACLGVIAVAIVGKLGGSMVAARFTGMSWGDSFALGALMNTRGLVELIVLNIGYDLGILSPRIFAMLVLMALVTTFMTGPLLHLRQVFGRRREDLLMEGGSHRPV